MRQLPLLLVVQWFECIGHAGGVGRKDPRNECLARGGELDLDTPAVVCLPLPPDQPAPLEIVDDEGDVAGAPEYPTGERGLLLGSQVKEGLQDAELGFREVVFRQGPVDRMADAVGGPKQPNEGSEGEAFTISSGIARHRSDLS